MPKVSPYGSIQTPSVLLEGRRPAAGTWFAHTLIHHQNRSGKYKITTGTLASEPNDIAFLGMITHIVQPEGTIERGQTDSRTVPKVRPKALLQTTSLDAQERAAVPISLSLAERRQALINILVSTARDSLELRGQRWQEHRDDPTFVEANRAKGQLLLEPIQRSRTQRRRETLSRLPETWDIRQRQEGRPNPGSTRAVLATIGDRMVGQLEFDSKSADSMGRRALISHDAMSEDIFQAALIIRLLAVGDPATIRAELPSLLHAWCAVPFVYAGSYIDWLFNVQEGRVDRSLWREYAIRAIDAELRLRSFNGILSNLRDDPELIDENVLSNLNATLDAIAFDGTYNYLAGLLQDGLGMLGAAADPAGDHHVSSVTKVVEYLKATLRNRFYLPMTGVTSSYAWNVRPAVDERNRPIWVAAARFGTPTGS